MAAMHGAADCTSCITHHCCRLAQAAATASGHALPPTALAALTLAPRRRLAAMHDVAFGALDGVAPDGGAPEVSSAVLDRCALPAHAEVRLQHVRWLAVVCQRGGVSRVWGDHKGATSTMSCRLPWYADACT
jgi:hypothetical protein